jgi:hypothetical protein
MEQDFNENFDKHLACLKDYREIAQHLGISDNTIYDRMKSGLVENKIYLLGGKRFIYCDLDAPDWGVKFILQPAGRKLSPRKEKTASAKKKKLQGQEQKIALAD